MGYVVEMNSIAFLIIFFIFDIIQFREYGLNMVLLNMLISATIVIVGYFLWRYRLGDLYYHERSRWKMDKDQVLRRLAKAMAARGARPQLETKDENMWFLLPPLSIVRRAGPWKACVTSHLVGCGTIDVVLGEPTQAPLRQDRGCVGRGPQ